jgi:Putative auto-transporter adhesin, head GIN domain
MAEAGFVAKLDNMNQMRGPQNHRRSETRTGGPSLAPAVAGVAGFGVVFLVFLTAACSSGLLGTTTGSGNLRTDNRSVSGFTGVQLSGVGDVQVQQGASDSLAVTAEDNLLPLLTSDVVDNVLRLGVKDGTRIDNRLPITFQVTVRQLTGLDVAGSGSQKATNVKTSSLHVRVTGSGSITAIGTADSQDVTMSGSGAYNGSGLTSITTKISSTGSGNADVAVRDRLEVSVTGSGSVTYTGSPQVTKSITGSGSVQKK